jgi:hypothetical protein
MLRKLGCFAAMIVPLFELVVVRLGNLQEIALSASFFTNTVARLSGASLKDDELQFPSVSLSDRRND